MFLQVGVVAALISLTLDINLENLSFSDVSPGEGTVVSPRVILSPGQGGREAPGDVVLEAGGDVGRVGRQNRPLQLVTHCHVRHRGSGGKGLVESVLSSILHLQGMTNSCLSRKLM